MFWKLKHYIYLENHFLAHCAFLKAKTVDVGDTEVVYVYTHMRLCTMFIQNFSECTHNFPSKVRDDLRWLVVVQ